MNFQLHQDLADVLDVSEQEGVLLFLLGQLPAFTAINSAIQVDLTGAVNAESVGGRYLGAVGGAAIGALTNECQIDLGPQRPNNC